MTDSEVSENVQKELNDKMNKNVETKLETTVETEPLLTEEKEERLTILPTMYHDLWDMYKTHEAAIWHAHEVKLTDDLKDWVKLTDDERYFIKHVLAFFASSDLIVVGNLAKRFMGEVKILEAQIFYAFQMMMENIHSETYANMIDTYITDKAEKTKLFNAVRTIPCVQRKAEWAIKWISSSASFAERLVAFAAVEGIFFSGAFCCIYWLKERGVMPGFTEANDFISRDEGLHTDFACLEYTKYIRNKLTQERLEEIIRDAVNIEIEFITESLPCRLIGMNAAMMITYIRYVANRLVKQLGHQEIYPNIKQPFGFIDRLGLNKKSNFFEKEPSEYSKGSTAHMEKSDPYADL
jgi:ribonucleotide reductase beta subunit family protein with ferritin-like domain